MCYKQDIGLLLESAASSILLLTLPQTDGPDDNLPQGGERSEQLALEIGKYFERLDVRTLVNCIYLRVHPDNDVLS